MITSDVSSVNETVGKANEWLWELREIGDFYTTAQAYTAMRAVLHTLRDRLTVDEAAHLGAQLPMLIRGLYYEGWRPSAVPIAQRSEHDFLMTVAHRLGNAQINAEHACRAVFALLRNRISDGEIDDVRQMLHHRLWGLWL
jgi:uncharacterized protein (DUF2267 family)